MDTAKRTIWKAGAIGVAIGTSSSIVVTLVPLIVITIYQHIPYEQSIFSADLFTGYFGAIFLPQLLRFVSLAALIGGIIGALLLRTKRTLLYSACLIPVMTLVAATVISTLGSYLSTRINVYQDNIADENSLYFGAVNYSANCIANVTLSGGDSASTIFDSFSHEPLGPGVTATTDINRTTQVMLAWRPQQVIVVSWLRPTNGTAFTYSENGENTSSNSGLTATVHLPRYQGSRNKALVAVFLPGDKVRVEVVDREHFDGTVLLPPSDEYVAQGVVSW